MKPRAKRVLKAFGALAVLYGGVLLLIYFMQDHLVFMPTHGYSDMPEAYGLKHEDVTLDLGSARVRGWFVHAIGTPRATILFFHGNGGNLSWHLGEIQQFGLAGFDAFAIDYEGYGDSTGSVSEANTYRDADAAWDWLTRTRGVEPKHIAIWGHSLGGGIATHCAESHPPGALVLQSTFTSVPDVGAHIYFWLPVRLLSHNFFGNLARIPSIHVPVLIAHGRGDRMIPFSMGEALFSAANEPKKFVELNGGHDDGLMATPSAWNDVKKLFEDAGVAEPR